MSKEKIYKCKYCGEEFHKSQKLGNHVYNIHKKRKQKCNICNEWFDIQVIDRHIKSHERDLTCSVCGKTIHRLPNQIKKSKTGKFFVLIPVLLN